MAAVAAGVAQTPDYSLYVRPISPAESAAALKSLRPARYNAVAMAIVGIATAIMINYANDAIVVVVPLMFAVGSISFAVRYRKGAAAVQKTISSGNIHEVRGVAVKKSLGRGWALGPVTFPRSGGLNDLMTEGAPAGVAFVPDTKSAISVNGALLRKPLPMTMPIGFGKDLPVPSSVRRTQIGPQATPAMLQQVSKQPEEDLPPPPDDWVVRNCPRCGQSLGEGVSFCSKCGFRLKG